MISLIVALHYPIQLHPVRRAILALLSRVSTAATGEQDSLQIYSVRYYVTTVSGSALLHVFINNF